MKDGIFLLVRWQAKSSSIFYSESATRQIDGQFLTASPSIPIRAKRRAPKVPHLLLSQAHLKAYFFLISLLCSCDAYSFLCNSIPPSFLPWKMASSNSVYFEMGNQLNPLLVLQSGLAPSLILLPFGSEVVLTNPWIAPIRNPATLGYERGIFRERERNLLLKKSASHLLLCGF